MGNDKRAHKHLLVEIRERLKEERIRRRMTQAALAATLGCSRKAIIDFENGATSPCFEFVERISIALGYKIEFSTGEGYRDPILSV